MHTTIRGYEFVEVTADDGKLARAMSFITEGLERGQFNPQIARAFAFEDIVEATRYLGSNAQFGKIVVKL